MSNKESRSLLCDIRVNDYVINLPPVATQVMLTEEPSLYGPRM